MLPAEGWTVVSRRVGNRVNPGVERTGRSW
jgi:hypothetical protein